MAKLIHWSGEESTVVSASPEGKFTRKEIEELLGSSHIQQIDLFLDQIMWVTGIVDLLTTNPLLNIKATAILQRYSYLHATQSGPVGLDDCILGDALITAKEEIA